MAAARGDRRASSPTTSCARTTSSPRSSTATSPPPSPTAVAAQAKRAGRGRGRPADESASRPATPRTSRAVDPAEPPARPPVSRLGSRTPGMKVTVTGASGLIGTQLVERAARPRRRRHRRCRAPRPRRRRRRAWQPEDEPAPAAALAGRDAVVHLAGENVAQRWTDDAKRRIRSSRERGTRNLVAGIEAADAAPARAGLLLRRRLLRPARRRARSTSRPRPATTSSPRSASSGSARRAARPSSACASSPSAPASCSTRTAARWRRCCRSSSSASAARSRAAGSTCRGSTSTTWSGSTSRRSTARTGRARSTPAPPSRSPTRRSRKALGRALHRPAFAPVPGLAVRVLYGEMAEIVTKGQRVVPAARRSSATRSRTRTSTRPCATRWTSRYSLIAVCVPPVSAASPVISASRGFWRRCHGLRSFHSAVASFGGIASQMSGPRTLRIRPVPRPTFSP